MIIPVFDKLHPSAIFFIMLTFFAGAVLSVLQFYFTDEDQQKFSYNIEQCLNNTQQFDQFLCSGITLNNYDQELNNQSFIGGYQIFQSSFNKYTSQFSLKLQLVPQTSGNTYFKIKYTIYQSDDGQNYTEILNNEINQPIHCTDQQCTVITLLNGTKSKNYSKIVIRSSLILNQTLVKSYNLETFQQNQHLLQIKFVLYSVFVYIAAILSAYFTIQIKILHVPLHSLPLIYKLSFKLISLSFLLLSPVDLFAIYLYDTASIVIQALFKAAFYSFAVYVLSQSALNILVKTIVYTKYESEMNKKQAYQMYFQKYNFSMYFSIFAFVIDFIDEILSICQRLVKIKIVQIVMGIITCCFVALLITYILVICFSTMKYSCKLNKYTTQTVERLQNAKNSNFKFYKEFDQFKFSRNFVIVMQLIYLLFISLFCAQLLNYISYFNYFVNQQQCYDIAMFITLIEIVVLQWPCLGSTLKQEFQEKMKFNEEEKMSLEDTIQKRSQISLTNSQIRIQSVKQEQ